MSWQVILTIVFALLVALLSLFLIWYLNTHKTPGSAKEAPIESSIYPVIKLPNDNTQR